MAKPRIMLVGYFGPGALECSYASAFQDIGCEIHSFDIVAAERRYCRLGMPGRLFNKFVAVEPWIRKANREMLIKALRFKPGVLVVFGQNRVLAGALAQVRATLSTATAYIWPDTLVNLNAMMIAALPLYDWVGTYSQGSVAIFECLGARRVEWLPLGADPHLHPVVPPRDEFHCDVAFVGQWRPEREKAMAALLTELPGISVKVWGPDWKRRTRHPGILRVWQKRSLHGLEFSQAVASVKVNLNIIDDTNYPAANMRFFEIPCAGGLQVCSSCPEMEDEFKHGETVFYYKTPDDLLDLIRSLLSDDSLCKRVAQKAHEKVLNEHTYKHRVQQILRMFK